MLPQEVVRIRYSVLLKSISQPGWKRASSLLALALATSIGCRSSFGPHTNAEPSFDRLLEIENGSTAMRAPDSSASPYAQQQVAQRRPGTSGNTAASRFANEVEVDDNIRVAKRRISDLDEQADEYESDVEGKLLRQTQLALRKTAEQAPDPEAEYADESLEVAMPAPAKKRSSKKNSDDQLVMRMTDKFEEETDVSSEVEAVVDNRKSKSPTKRVPEQSSWDDAVQSASYTGKVDRAVKQPNLPVPVDVEYTESLTWEQHLREAYEQLNENASKQELISPQDRIRKAMIARLMALSLNDRESMLAPIEGLQVGEQDYVNHQLSAIFDAIDPEANPVSSKKWSMVMLNQRKANTHLASLSNLEINNLAFCTEVFDFGVTAPFTANRFAPDQEVLLYLELDNFVSEKSKDGKGFETQLQGSYEIVDSAGRRVADQTLPADSHICKNIRRDYFIAYRVYMPPKLSTGNYTLKLTVEDLKGRKFGQADIQFQIQ